MKQIMIRRAVGWSAAEAKGVPGHPSDEKFVYTTGAILDVVPNLNPEDEYVKGTVPEGRAQGMCNHDIACEYTPEAIAAIEKREKERTAKLVAAKAAMQNDE